MKKLILLLKLQLSMLFGLSVIRYTRDEEQRKKAKRTLMLTVFSVVICLVMSCSYSVMMAEAFEPIGMMRLLPMIMFVSTTVLILISSIARVKSVLFGFGDYDLMMSLPIRPSTVAISRLLTFYVLDLLFSAAILLPAGIVYSLKAQIAPSYYPILVLMVFVAPMVPLSVGGLIGTLLGVALARFKFKNALSTIAQLIFVIGVMAFSFASSSISQNIGGMAEMLGARMTSIYPPSALFASALCDGDYVDLIIFSGISLAFFGLFALLVVSKFKQLSTTMKAVYQNRRFRLKKQQGRSSLAALYIREWKHYTSSTLYFLNTAFSSILLLLGLVYVVIFGRIQLSPLVAVLADYGHFFAPVLAAVMGWLLCMSVPTSACISIEGKQLWLAKALPIRANDWLRSKLMVSLTLPVPTAIIGAIVLTLALALPPITMLEIAAILLTNIYFFSVFGLWVNLKNHRFDWKSEQEIVKQGAPVFILIASAMAGNILPLILALVLNLWWVSYAFTAILLVLSIVLRAYIGRNAEVLKASL